MITKGYLFSVDLTPEFLETPIEFTQGQLRWIGTTKLIGSSLYVTWMGGKIVYNNSISLASCERQPRVDNVHSYYEPEIPNKTVHEANLSAK